MTNTRLKNTLSILSTIITIILAIVSSLLVIRNVCYTNIVVHGASMYPTLQTGDFGYALSTDYAKNNIKTFDIIIFEREENDKKYDLIKRVIALPGQTYEFKGENCDLYINDEFTPQAFISLEYQKLTCEGSTSVIKKDVKYTVPENHYFVLGDNRGNSRDSAHGLGNVKQDEIVGILKVITSTCNINNDENVCDDKKYVSFKFF